MLKRLFRAITRAGAKREQAPAEALVLHVGTTTGHHYGLWDGRVYPSGLIGSDLRGYSAYAYDTIEIRSSFYSLPKTDTLAQWAEQVPPEFRFALLAPSRITHLHRLDDAELPVRRFLRAARALGANCGPILFQLPHGFEKDEARLARFLDSLPVHTLAAFEFLDSSWHDEAVYDRLRQRNFAVSVRDSDESEPTPFAATADWGYLRLGRAYYTDEELRQWLDQIRKTAWRTAYVYLRHENDERAHDHMKRLEGLASG